MAFGGVQANTLIGPTAGPLGLTVSGITLAANIGAFAIAAADSGALTTDSTPPANTNAIPAAFGPGEGNWTQADVDAVMVFLDNAVVVANARIGLVSKVLTAGNLVVNIHSLEAGIPGAISVTLLYLHTIIRGR